MHCSKYLFLIYISRYGWLSNSEPESQNLQSPSASFHFTSNFQSKECAQNVSSVPERFTKIWDGHQADNLVVAPNVVPETELANNSLKSKNLHGESLQHNISQNVLKNEKKQRSDEEVPLSFIKYLRAVVKSFASIP